jgi:hypothetical protein
MEFKDYPWWVRINLMSSFKREVLRRTLFTYTILGVAQLFLFNETILSGKWSYVHFIISFFTGLILWLWLAIRWIDRHGDWEKLAEDRTIGQYQFRQRLYILAGIICLFLILFVIIFIQ